jgi:tRNA(Ile)-lysidine synthase TilS/MesJ
MLFSKLQFPIPPWTTHGKRLESAVRKAIFDFNLFEGVSRLGIALSGGKDSITMLFLLHAISGHGMPPFEMVGLHVSHEGKAISPLVEEACSHLAIPLYIDSMSYTHNDCYSCSRERRRLLFSMAQQADCSSIAFGHHRDDNAQTVLMNLLHKAEFAGLLPKIHLAAYNTTIIRPLIYLEEKDTETFVKYYGLTGSTCQCAAGHMRLRKKTDRLLEEIEEIYPNARGNLAQAALQFGSKKAQEVPKKFKLKLRALNKS